MNLGAPEFETAALAAECLTRRFGERLAVDRIDFTVSYGEIFGLLGPNSAGKSTTVRMPTGYLATTAGHARREGIDVAFEPCHARRHIGVVPEEANVYADLSALHNVLLMAELHGVPRAERERRCRDLLTAFGLDGRAAQQGGELSKGLRQRLMLCMALVSEPSVSFLDEPTSGLDVASAHLIRDVVARLNREQGMTALLTTHNVAEAETLCQRVGILRVGRLAAIDTPPALRRRVASRRSVVATVTGTVPDTAMVLPAIEIETAPLPAGWRVYAAEPGPLAQHIAVRCAALGLELASLSTVEPSLEDVFVSITGDDEVRH
jgi:ABC-2 type transport system ATP-binding protein